MRALASLLLFAALAAAQEVTGLGEHHEPSRSVDLVFIGDGFTLAEKDEYEKIIDRMAAIGSEESPRQQITKSSA